jgi:predicted DsbA family dithiol-disulfide isomerase
MRVGIRSDIVCPWCYIGEARFERALAGFPHQDQIQVDHRSFELDPSRDPARVEPVQRMLVAKFGPRARDMEEQVAETLRHLRRAARRHLRPSPPASLGQPHPDHH